MASGGRRLPREQGTTVGQIHNSRMYRMMNERDDLESLWSNAVVIICNEWNGNGSRKLLFEKIVGLEYVTSGVEERT